MITQLCCDGLCVHDLRT